MCTGEWSREVDFGGVIGLLGRLLSGSEDECRESMSGWTVGWMSVIEGRQL